MKQIKKVEKIVLSRNREYTNYEVKNDTIDSTTDCMYIKC